MKPYADNIVTVGMMLRGYRAATSRFQEAIGSRDPLETFTPLFEALNWAVALDDRIGEHWAPDGAPLKFGWRERVPGSEAMQGVRFVRNRVHHQWSDAIELRDGARFPATFPVRFHAWVWRPLGELPVPPPTVRPDPVGETVYSRLLAGHLPDMTLQILLEVFEQVGGLLEPPSPNTK